MSLAEAKARRHLIVVDDDDRIRELIKQYLGREGFRVTTASGGAAARRLMENLDFDLAVFDVMMPGEDGFSLTRWLRERSGPAGRTPVLMLTARGLPEDRIEGLRTGADDYLPKPFEPEEL
ncbi:MAG TPA: response regulator, partial [Phenylobacterium sp.]